MSDLVKRLRDGNLTVSGTIKQVNELLELHLQAANRIEVAEREAPARDSSAFTLEVAQYIDKGMTGDDWDRNSAMSAQYWMDVAKMAIRRVREIDKAAANQTEGESE